MISVKRHSINEVSFGFPVSQLRTVIVRDAARRCMITISGQVSHGVMRGGIRADFGEQIHYPFTTISMIGGIREYLDIHH